MTTFAPSGPVVRRGLRVSGVVQGVGYRPFVHRLARELDLVGHVGNDRHGVFVEVEGPAAAVARFEHRLVEEVPPLAQVFGIEARSLVPRGEREFRVAESEGDGTIETYVSPDVAVCEACLAEVFDPSDRRYRYPFVNCTNCGPRFTITVRLPYDRPNTTMAGFTMCDSCAAEYRDPADRRFHAQPIACPACGPRLVFENSRGHGGAVGDAALVAAQEALAAGRIVAVKGIGGYHLACDATSEEAVRRLRGRKQRAEKPLAVMVAALPDVRRLARVGPAEAALLESPRRPIVLLRRLDGSPLARSVAPGNPRLGVLLPYSPVHHLLFAPVPGRNHPVGGHGPPAPRALVMTSGNLSEEPICHDDADARRRLGGIADAWLVHDRPIHVPCDDSVVQVVDGEEQPVRRSRGYAPLPVQLPTEVPPLLATGGELKNTFCVAKGRTAWLSQHVGDMGSLETLHALERSVEQFTGIYEVSPVALATDLHPGYQVRRWAERRLGAETERPGHGRRRHPGGEAALELVQHHHAHLASVLTEHGLGPGTTALGFTFDGTGFGTDGTVWGGEVLVGDVADAERVAHLRPVSLPGGDGAVRRPYRMALAHLRAAGLEWDGDLPPVRAAGRELAALRSQLSSGTGCLSTSSMGRLFDAVSSLLGICHRSSFEAQAAMALQALAEEGDDEPHGNAESGNGESGNGESGNQEPRFCLELSVADGEIDPGPVLAGMVRGVRRGVPRARMAAGFHRAVAEMVAEVVEAERHRHRFEVVVLTGGVFQNALLVRLTRQRLSKAGCPVLVHRIVPPNDGGLALGQLAVAAARLQRRRREATGDGVTSSARLSS